MGFESFDQTNERAKRAINEVSDPNFEEKYEAVRPHLEKYQEKADFAESKAEQSKKIEEREKEDKGKISTLKEDLAKEIRSTKAEPVNTIGIEQTMFTPKKMKERAENRIMMMQSGKNPEAANQPWSEKAEEILKQNGIEKRIPSSSLEQVPSEEVSPSDAPERTPQEKRAENVLSMIEKGKLNTVEKRTANRLNFNAQIEARDLERQEKKNRAQQLAAWWKRLNGKN